MVIPIRSNGDKFQVAWVNVLRMAILSIAGAGGISETAFTVANNQSASNVTGASVDSASYRGLIVEYDIYRKTDTALSELRTVGRLSLGWYASTSTWTFLGDDYQGDPHGITWSVTTSSTTGQLQYASSNIAGANYVGKMAFRARSFNA